MDNEHFKHVVELYAKAKGWELSPFADKIINRCLTACNGHCPCGEHEHEIAEMGHCHCNLFIQKK